MSGPLSSAVAMNALNGLTLHKGVGQLLPQVHARILVDRDDVHICEADTRSAPCAPVAWFTRLTLRLAGALRGGLSLGKNPEFAGTQD